MKILIVEDQTSIQFKIVELIKIHLEIPGSNILLANNGLEAIKIAEKNNLDFILMDIQMPIMNGIEATEKIINKHPQIKIIIITSYDDEILVQKSINAGAKGYLFKQNISTSLRSTIDNVTNGSTNFLHPQSNSILNSTSDSIVLPNKMEQVLKIDKIIALIVIKNWADGRVNDDLTQEKFLKGFSINPEFKTDMTNFLIQGDSSKCSLVDELDLRLKYLGFAEKVSEKIDKNQLG